MRSVTHGYFETMRIPLLEGRAPRPGDRAADGAPVLLSANLAARLFPGRSAVGERVRHQGAETWNTVMGVVADVHEDGPAEPAPEVVYVPVLDAPTFRGTGPGYLAFAVRATVPATSLVSEVRRIVRSMDPRMPIGSVRTMEEIVASRTARLTFTTVLVVLAGVAAMFLGAIGIHGTLSEAVGRRRREIGVRMSLGADAASVVRLIVGEGVALTVAGVVAGLAMAAALSRFLEALLYEVDPTDPLSFAAATAAVLLIAVVACTLPARRAARVEPTETLAAE